MIVRTLFFASYRDLVGADSVEIDLPEPATVAHLVTALRGRPGLSVLPERPAVALNLEYVRHDAPLRAGDEVALIPPVAGG